MQNLKTIFVFIMASALISFGFSTGEPHTTCVSLRVNFYEIQNGAALAQDAVILAFDDRFNDAFDQEDARKQHRNGPSLGIVHPDATLSVEKRRSLVSGNDIPLRIQNLEPGKIYLFKASGQNLNQLEHDFILWDDYLKKSYQIDKNAVLSIEFQIDGSPESFRDNRFSLIPVCRDQTDWAYREKPAAY